MIGLTGGVGSGKSTVAGMFRKPGVSVLDADKITHQLIEPEGECFKAVVKCFGHSILTHGVIDRTKLGGIVFKDIGQLKKLERIIHPKVIKRIEKNIIKLKKEGKVKVLLIEVPLLFESGLDRMVDATILVRARQRDQIQRTSKRLSIPKQQVRNRLNQQMPLGDKIRLADFVIDNRGTKKQTQKQVQHIWCELLKKLICSPKNNLL